MGRHVGHAPLQFENGDLLTSIEYSELHVAATQTSEEGKELDKQ